MIWNVEGGITPEKLTDYEIRRGEKVYFPQIDEAISRQKFVPGWDTPYDGWSIEYL
jgi:hypothetical protein